MLDLCCNKHIYSAKSSLNYQRNFSTGVNLNFLLNYSLNIIMGNQTSQTRSIVSDERHDEVFIFKISEDPSLSEKLKTVEIPEVFTPLKEFFKHQLQVCINFLVRNH